MLALILCTIPSIISQQLTQRTTANLQTKRQLAKVTCLKACISLSAPFYTVEYRKKQQIGNVESYIMDSSQKI
jgi:hypothetical protein